MKLEAVREEEPLQAPNSSLETPPRLLVLLAFAAVYLIWGSTYLAIRFAIETIPPLLMSGGRHLVAGFILLGAVRCFTPHLFGRGSLRE